MRSPLSLVLVVLVLGVTVSASGGATAMALTEDAPSTARTAAPTSFAGTSSEDACTPLSSENETSDPDRDRLGWENGCWYNASIRVDENDGLNRTEMDAVVARAMARVEVVRQLEFERTVPVSVVSRREYANRTAGHFANVSGTDRLRENIKWEALLMVGENTDAVSVQRSNMVAGVGGYYSLAEDRIFIVSDNRTSPKMDEVTLSEELFHALQNRQFDVSERFGVSNFDSGRHTMDSLNALKGVIEGDGGLVRMRYEERCNEEWDCLTPVSPDSDAERHMGMYFVNVQPYSDGPKFVDQVYKDRGWEGVNALYENPPVNTEQVMYPERYREETPTNVTFTDRSRGEWHLLESGNDRSAYLSFGMPGITSMLIYPYYDSGRHRSPVMPPRLIFNATPTGVSNYDPLTYGRNPFAKGWNGDRLYPYVRSDSAETGETGYVWKSVWDTESDARQFANGYTTLLEYYNATNVSGHENTYRIPEDDRFADAYYVGQSGDTVYVVNAPSVEDLSQVRAGAAPEVEQTTNATGTDTSLGVPGFGAVAVLVALAGALLVACRPR